MRRILACCLIQVLAANLAQPALAADPEISAEARGYFRNGVELLQSDPPNYQDAYYQFKLAYEGSNSWKVLGNLGFCALKLERDGEALEYYEEYLKRGGQEIVREEREAIERDMLLVRGNAVSLEIRSPSGEIEIHDQRAGSAVGAQKYTLTGGERTFRVRAGAHTLAAIDQQGKRLTWSVALRPGETASRVFDFNAPEPQTEPETPQQGKIVAVDSEAKTPRAGSWWSPLRTVGFITAGFGAVAMGAAIPTWLVAESRKHQADKPETQGGCPADPKIDCPVFDQAQTYAKATTVLLIAGGGVAAVGLGMVLFGGSGEPEPGSSGFLLSPVFATRGGGVSVSGRF